MPTLQRVANLYASLRWPAAKDFEPLIGEWHGEGESRSNLR
jgi:hypothetical protein